MTEREREREREADRRHFVQLTEAVFDGVTVNIRELRRLNLQKCESINDHTIEAIADGASGLQVTLWFRSYH